MSIERLEIADYRYNPFTETFTAKPIGYSGNPVETKIIPSVAPFWVFLDELPRQDTISSLLINEQGGSSFTEVSKTTPPAAGQFRAIYGGDGTTISGNVGQGIVEFHSSDAGKTVEIKYYGLGSILQKQFYDIKDIEHNRNPFELTDYTDSAIIKFAEGRGEEINGEMFIVKYEDYTITDSGVANGTVYVHLKSNGDGTADAYLSTIAGTWDPTKGAYYHTDGAKVLFQMYKSTGPIYSRKSRKWPNDPGGEVENSRWGATDLDQAMTIRSLIF